MMSNTTRLAKASARRIAAARAHFVERFGQAPSGGAVEAAEDVLNQVTPRASQPRWNAISERAQVHYQWSGDETLPAAMQQFHEDVAELLRDIARAMRAESAWPIGEERLDREAAHRAAHLRRLSSLPREAFGLAPERAA